jgi:hypothetical protein
VQEHATALADAIEAALPGWVERSVERVLVAWLGKADAKVMARAGEAGEAAAANVGGAVRALLATDVDEQRTTPLTILRGAVRYPTAVLRDAGVPPVVRDEYQERAFPDDDYDLTPASFADVSPEVGELGITWGAAKAMVHLNRRREIDG